MKKYKSLLHDYSTDYKNRFQGEYKYYHLGPNDTRGSLAIRCFFKDDRYHGEYRSFSKTGCLEKRILMIDGKEYKEKKIEDLTANDRLMLIVKYSIKFQNDTH